jgi:hypothetical protein
MINHPSPRGTHKLDNFKPILPVYTRSKMQTRFSVDRANQFFAPSTDNLAVATIHFFVVKVLKRLDKMADLAGVASSTAQPKVCLEQQIGLFTNTINKKWYKLLFMENVIKEVELSGSCGGRTTGRDVLLGKIFNIAAVSASQVEVAE